MQGLGPDGDKLQLKLSTPSAKQSAQNSISLDTKPARLQRIYNSNTMFSQCFYKCRSSSVYRQRSCF
jgi:hypothetical protein